MHALSWISRVFAAVGVRSRCPHSLLPPQTRVGAGSAEKHTGRPNAPVADAPQAAEVVEGTRDGRAPWRRAPVEANEDVLWAMARLLPAFHDSDSQSDSCARDPPTISHQEARSRRSSPLPYAYSTMNQLVTPPNGLLAES